MSEPLGDIEMGFSREQAAAIIVELDALYAHSNVMGKKKMKQLHIFRASMVSALAQPDEPVKVGGTT
jgi:hypothetical protein